MQILRSLLFSLALSCAVLHAGGIENIVVYSDPSEFAGWPANEGMWSWGDEILVGYNVGAFEERGEKHSIVGEIGLAFSRSRDGGMTWQVEKHPNVVTPEKVKSGIVQQVTAPFDFSDPDFIMKLRGRFFFTSKNRGKDWSGPYRLPDFGHLTNARTNYLITGKHSCLIFLSCEVKDEEGQRARSFVAETTDGGQTFQFLSWIGDDLMPMVSPKDNPEGEIFSTMPSAVRLEDGRLICAIRNRIDRRKWSDIYESTDGGKSWTMISELEKGSTNPAVLVVLEGQRMAAIYGNRRKAPFGLSAKISEDGGKSWSDEIALREDGRKWDLGYPRAILRSDGAVVATYYYTTEENPQQFIAATIWKPASQ